MSVHQSLRERAWSLFFSLHIRRSSGLWSLCSWLHWLPEKVSKQLCKYKLYFQGPNPLVFGWESFIKIMVKFSRSIFLFIQCCWRCVGTSNPLLPLCKIEMNSELVWSYVGFFFACSESSGFCSYSMCPLQENSCWWLPDTILVWRQSWGLF